MVATQELSFILTGLVLYLLGVITPNHHPKQTMKSLGTGVVNMLTAIVSAFYLPEVFRHIGSSMKEPTYRITLLVLLTIFSILLVSIRYYVVEDKIRDWSLEI